MGTRVTPPSCHSHEEQRASLPEVHGRLCTAQQGRRGQPRAKRGRRGEVCSAGARTDGKGGGEETHGRQRVASEPEGEQ